MNTSRKLAPSRSLVLFSSLISVIIGYAIYYAFTEGNELVRIAVIIAAALLLLPILKMPIKIYQDNDSICIQQVMGERKFLKQEYTINQVKTNGLFSIRLFATSFFVYLGYFWTKSTGVFYAQCVSSSNLIMLTKKSDGTKIVIDAP